MARGRTKTPKAILERRGSKRAKYESPEPDVSAIQKIPQIDLEGKDVVVKKNMERLIEAMDAIGVLTELDGMALELLADCYDEYVKIKSLVYPAEPTEFHSTSNPEWIDAWRMLTVAKKNYKDMLLQFGLTPSARSKMQAMLASQQGSKHGNAKSNKKLKELF